MKVDTLCAEAIQHLKKIIELGDKHSNDYSYGSKVREYLNEIRLTKKGDK